MYSGEIMKFFKSEHTNFSDTVSEYDLFYRIFVTNSLHSHILEMYIGDAPYLMQKDEKYGGVKPRRSSIGYRFAPDGFSDHLPVVMKLSMQAAW